MYLSFAIERDSHLIFFMKHFRREDSMEFQSVTGSFAPMSVLAREEQTALWALRYLLGPTCWRRSTLLKSLLGREAEKLQERFKALFLHAVCGTESLEYSVTEARLLDVLSDIQHVPQAQELRSELGEALVHLGLALAAYGYWLPVRTQREEKMPMPTLMQDNSPLMMQAAE